jgi:uncharacterized protein (TIGR02996 family)
MSRSQAPPSRLPTPFPLEPFFRALRGCEPFLHEIAERPWDDAVRLIFADWLEDQGAADRAELMRLQIRLAALPTGARPAREAQRAAQLESIAGWPGAPGGVCMERGLYTHAILNRPVYQEWAKQRRQDVNRPDSLLRMVGEIQSLIDLQALTVAVTLGPGWLEKLASSAQLATVTTLRFAWGAIGAAGARALASATGLTHLRDLDLWGAGIETNGARALAGCRLAGRLHQLNLGANRLGDAGAAAIAHAPAELAVLDLMQNEITSRGAKELAQGVGLEKLTNLNLFANQVDDSGARALVGSPHLGRLRDLDLRGNRISAAGQRAVKERWSFAKTA